MPKNSDKPRGRGRPSFKPSPAQRRDVSIAAGGGMRHEEIAIALGIHVDTLRKHFESELSVGANVRRLEALKGLHKAAKRGSSSAAKAYLAVEPQIAVPPGEGDSPRPQQPTTTTAPAEPKPEKVGKKEQANKDATTAAEGTAWDDVLPKHPGSAPLH